MVEAEVMACAVVESLLNTFKHLFVLANNDSFLDCLVLQCVVVDDGLVVRIAYHPHHALQKGLARTQIPVFKAWNQVNVHVGLLVHHIHSLVPGACDSCYMLRSECLKNLIHA